ncbi:MAG TPA: hypothetical protein VGK44_19705 [Casimicrobiaceae bacterium]
MRRIRCNRMVIARLLSFVEGLSICLVAVSNVATAAAVSITSYDVEQTPRAGFGCWSHNYAGTIANIGRTVSGSIVCAANGNQIANYFGGSGTLNDGQFSSSILETHLFTTRNADDGQPIVPKVTLHLGGTFVINAIRLFGGDIGGNIIPGALDGVTIEIGGASVSLATIPFGSLNAIGTPINDLVDLSTTALASIPTDTIVLRNFSASFFDFPLDQFSITEITVDGTAAALSVAVDINPGDFPNSINTQAHGTLTVAILSSPNFDAANEVDETSLTFGRVGDEKSFAYCGNAKDTNHDKLPDLVCHFNVQDTGFLVGDTLGVLRGKTRDGFAIRGTDSVRIVH